MQDESALPGDDEEWIIDIAGYGAFYFRGNEADAEFMRAEKARWEGTTGRKWRAADPTFGLESERRNAEVLRRERGDVTQRALDFAQKYPCSVADWRNYGRSPASEEAIAAIRERPSQAQAD